MELMFSIVPIGTFASLFCLHCVLNVFAMCLQCVCNVFAMCFYRRGLDSSMGAIEEIDKAPFFDLNYQLDCF